MVEPWAPCVTAVTVSGSLSASVSLARTAIVTGVPEVVEAVHAYGGLVFHDVTTLRHARKAASAGVDGLVLVAGGAGGHAGTLNPFAFVASVRPWFDGTLLLAGGLSARGRPLQLATCTSLGWSTRSRSCGWMPTRKPRRPPLM